MADMFVERTKEVVCFYQPHRSNQLPGSSQGLPDVVGPAHLMVRKKTEKILYDLFCQEGESQMDLVVLYLFTSTYITSFEPHKVIYQALYKQCSTSQVN